MTLWQIYRPIFVSTVLMGAAFALAALWFGSTAATRVVSVAFVLSNLAVLSLWLIVAVLAIQMPQLRIVLTVVNAAAHWFIVRIGVPLSNLIVLIILFVTNDPELSSFGSIINTIASERGTFQRLGVGLAFVICALFVDKALTALGYPGAIVHENDARRARLQSRAVLLVCAGIGTVFALLVPLPMGGTISTIVVLGIFIILAGFVLSWRFAHRAHGAALVVCPHASTSTPTNPWALHVTDVHLTLPGTARVEGEGDGRDRLAALVAAKQIQSPRYLFLSGDITDHGHGPEWDEAAKVLAPLRASGCRVLVAPGNHDLSMAYDGSSQFRAQVALHVYGMTRQMEYKYGVRFLNYLKFQSGLADDILFADGQQIAFAK